MIYRLVELTQFWVSFFRSVVTKRELSNTAELSVFKSVFVPILSYGHESFVMTEDMLSRVQAAEMGLLRKVHGVKLRDKERRCEFRCACVVNVQLLLRNERSQLHWFGHVSRMPYERLARQGLLAKPMRKRLRACSRTRWNEYIYDLAWLYIGVKSADLPEIAVDCEVFCVLLGLLPP